MSEEKTDIEQTEELFRFLQGELPEGYKIPKRKIPKLTSDQAWTVIWYLGNQYWKVPDFIERCCVCGSIYNSNSEGTCIDDGKSPSFYCDSCEERCVSWKDDGTAVRRTQ